MALLEMGFNYKSLSKIAVYLKSKQNGMGFALVGIGCVWLNWKGNRLEGFAESLSTGSLTINFHKGNVGKIQLTRIVKSLDLKSIWFKKPFLVFFVVVAWAN